MRARQFMDAWIHWRHGGDARAIRPQSWTPTTISATNEAANGV